MCELRLLDMSQTEIRRKTETGHLVCWCDPGYVCIAGCTFPLPSLWAHGCGLHSLGHRPPFLSCPVLLCSSPLPSLFSHPPNPFLPRPQECVCSFPVLSGFNFLAAVFLLCCLLRFALLALLRARVGFLCAFSPAPPFSFLCSACVWCAPLPVFFLLFPRCWLWLAVLVPSFHPPPRLCVCTLPRNGSG